MSGPGVIVLSCPWTIWLARTALLVVRGSSCQLLRLRMGVSRSAGWSGCSMAARALRAGPVRQQLLGRVAGHDRIVRLTVMSIGRLSEMGEFLHRDDLLSLRSVRPGGARRSATRMIVNEPCIRPHLLRSTERPRLGAGRVVPSLTDRVAHLLHAGQGSYDPFCAGGGRGEATRRRYRLPVRATDLARPGPR